VHIPKIMTNFVVHLPIYISPTKFHILCKECELTETVCCRVRRARGTSGWPARERSDWRSNRGCNCPEPENVFFHVFFLPVSVFCYMKVASQNTRHHCNHFLTLSLGYPEKKKTHHPMYTLARVDLKIHLLHNEV
jgi:hypothetical protein